MHGVGEVDFDVVIATPDTMKIVSPLGKVLGPKGIMPNPKIQTVKMIKVNFKIFSFLRIKATKNIENIENLLIKLPATNSSPKKPEL